MSLKITIDSSFIEDVFNFFENSSQESLADLTQHQAAKDIYENATMFNSTSENIENFWKTILEREKKKGKEYFQKILLAQDYFSKQTSDFTQAFNEINNFIPKETNLECTLYQMLGYDLGIANDRNALINLGHHLYHEFNRELLYFSMHELHHVVYFNYHPMRTMDEIKTTEDLVSLLKFLTHLEGLATYLTLEKRIKENGLTFKDYKVLTNERETRKHTQEYFEVLNRIAEQPKREIQEEDFKVFEIMSGGPRLWYVAGGQIAKQIDEKLGREALVQTMIDGAESFFNQYNSLM
ncbi:MAG: hypothetical protein GF308_18525 [Candidatus Heimdallarchaeota archaeon]|nr:hypothetical protein [Candidatus Heimdallarchaeota archaeon]